MTFIIYLYWIGSFVVVITVFGSAGMSAGLSAIGTIAVCAGAGLHSYVSIL